MTQLVQALLYKPEDHGFDRHIPTGHDMAPGSTQPLTEMGTRNCIYCL
jgi:hypothetical protein